MRVVGLAIEPEGQSFGNAGHDEVAHGEAADDVADEDCGHERKPWRNSTADNGDEKARRKQADHDGDCLFPSCDGTGTWVAEPAGETADNVHSSFAFDEWIETRDETPAHSGMQPCVEVGLAVEREHDDGVGLQLVVCFEKFGLKKAFLTSVSPAKLHDANYSLRPFC